MKRAFAGLLLVLGAIELWQGSWLYAKAWLAQRLLESSWRATLAGDCEARPWPWADTWPVARLRMPDHRADLIVLEGASGAVMAFAPGRLHSSADPGGSGACVIAGHRDTHFAVLEALRVGDEVTLEDARGVLTAYRVAATEVTDHRDLSALECDGESCLVLVTCWPFAALRTGSPERYVVRAVPAGGG